MKTLNAYIKPEDDFLINIPENWKIIKFRYLFDVQKGKLPKHLVNEKSISNFPYLSMDVLRGKEPTEFTSDNECVKVNIGDTVVLWDGSKSGEIILVKKYGILSSTLSLISLKTDLIDKEYSYFLLKAYEQLISGNTIGMGIPHVNGNYLKEIKLIIPTISQQKLISNYLNRKILITQSLLKNLKSKKNKIYEGIVNFLLEYKFNATDLNTFPKKWFNRIPNKWKIVKLKDIFIHKKITHNSDNERLLSVTQDRGVIYRDEQETNVMSPSGDKSSYKLVEPGDVIISLRSAEGGLETSFVRGLVSPAYIVLKPKLNIDTVFYKFLFKSENFITEIGRYIKGVRDGKNIYFEDIKDIEIPYLPENMITNSSIKIKKNHKKILDLFLLIDKKLNILNEYQNSLIFSAVIGKLKITKEMI